MKEKKIIYAKTDKEYLEARKKADVKKIILLNATKINEKREKEGKALLPLSEEYFYKDENRNKNRKRRKRN